MKFKVLLAGVSLLICLGSLSLADQEPTPVPANDLEKIAHLNRLPSEERIALLSTYSRNRYDTQGMLLQQLDPDAPKETIFAVAFLLGHHRMEQSVGNLNRFLTLENKPSTFLDDRRPLYGQYPVVEALIKIGRPSIPTMLTNLETSDDEKVRECSVKVIRIVEDSEIAQFIIGRAIADQADAKRKQRLQAALKLLPPILLRGGTL